MARVYKEFKQNGKAIKKWVDEYIAFDFDEDGNIISDTSKYGDIADEYDKKGNRINISSVFKKCNSEIDDHRPYIPNGEMIQKSFALNKNVMGNQEIEVLDEDNLWYRALVWKDINCTDVFAVVLGNIRRDFSISEIEFDKDNNLIHIKVDDTRYYFQYDEKKFNLCKTNF